MEKIIFSVFMFQQEAAGLMGNGSQTAVMYECLSSVNQPDGALCRWRSGRAADVHAGFKPVESGHF